MSGPAVHCAISETGTFFGYRVRRRFYGHLLDACGARLEINDVSTIAEPASRIGTNVWGAPATYLDPTALS